MTHLRNVWLVALCATAGLGCTDDADRTQLLTGRVTDGNAIAVRAVDGTNVVTASRVRSDGRFTLQLPAGHRYRLEVMTASGVHNVVHATGGIGDIAFEVCKPTDPFDMGGVGDPGYDPMKGDGEGCGGGGGTCDPGDPMCGDPWPCDPEKDPMCKPDCKPDGTGCDGGGGGGGNCDPGDPMCKPDCKPDGTGCDGGGGGGGNCDPGDPMCGDPWPCDPAKDPMCKPDCKPDGTGCGGGGGDNCDPLADGTCPPEPPCDPNVDPMCPTPPPPCKDPTDPETCKDPCMADPQSCGCSEPANPDGTPKGGTGDGNTGTGSCWPPPEECTMQSCPDKPWTPDNAPTDFGCEDGAA